VAKLSLRSRKYLYFVNNINIKNERSLRVITDKHVVLDVVLKPLICHVDSELESTIVPTFAYSRKHPATGCA
jgi:hypothetical protein